MKSQKKPVVILSIDQTIFKTKLFKEKLAYTNILDESEYIELFYLTEKNIFQELVIKRNIPINIFSTRKELLIKGKTFSNSATAKRLKDYLEDYKDYHIYLVSDHPLLLKEAKIFNKDIITILLHTKTTIGATTNKGGADKVINTLEAILPIIASIPLTFIKHTINK